MCPKIISKIIIHPTRSVFNEPKNVSRQIFALLTGSMNCLHPDLDKNYPTFYLHCISLSRGDRWSVWSKPRRCEADGAAGSSSPLSCVPLCVRSVVKHTCWGLTCLPFLSSACQVETRQINAKVSTKTPQSEALRGQGGGWSPSSSVSRALPPSVRLPFTLFKVRSHSPGPFCRALIGNLVMRRR